MTPDPQTHLALAQLLPDLRSDPNLSVDRQALEGLNHRRVFSAALDGRIPAERINGRWYVKRDDRQKIAKLLGVMPKPRVGRPARQQATSPSNAAVTA